MFVPFFSIRREKSIARRAGTTTSSSSTGKTSSSSTTGKTSGTSSGAGSSTGKGTTGSTSSTGKTTSSGTTGKTSSSTSSSSTTRKTTSISSGGSTKSVSTYSNGGGKIIVIAIGQIFGGRREGGATRSQVYGTRAYGSGYPGYYTRGVSGRPFPFYFWPLVWASEVGHTDNSAYLYDTTEYGQPVNTSRPGGPMAMAIFQSNSNGTTFRLVADNTTVADLMADVATNCSQWLTPASINATTPTPSNGSVEPEQMVQYYRASSVALTLDGYNNSAIFAPENSTADTPLPTGIDTNLMGCLNYTIGLATPLINGVPRLSAPDFRLGGLLLLLLIFQ